MVNQMLFGKRKPPTGDGSAFRYLHGMSSGYLDSWLSDCTLQSLLSSSNIGNSAEV